jgi:hypothetical protein
MRHSIIFTAAVALAPFVIAAQVKVRSESERSETSEDLAKYYGKCAEAGDAAKYYGKRSEAEDAAKYYGKRSEAGSEADGLAEAEDAAKYYG